MKQKISVFWHRRDLRITDNAGLYYALKEDFPVLPVFIFDRNILDELSDKRDARVEFIYDNLLALKKMYEKHNSGLQVFYSSPAEAFTALMQSYDIQNVYTNRDYEPYAQQRDRQIFELLKEKGINFKGHKDHVIFEKNEILKNDGTPYTIFTPYAKKWKDLLNPFYLQPYAVEKYLSNLLKANPFPFITLEEMGFLRTGLSFPSPKPDKNILASYESTRNFPAVKGTSRLSVHLRFGTISIRALAQNALDANTVFLNELIWRDFYQMIIFHFPHTVSKAFKPAYDNIKWRNNQKEFELWCAGQTGYPIVDAGMRELNQTGFMHNRVRMITASFLTKHLLIDWRWGEAYFAGKLLDFELASNVGGWQWAAGCGCDAAPYFRVFNPTLQMQKFDPDFKYIKTWVAEYGTNTYPKPMVEHTFARDRVLKTFKAALNA